MALPEFQYLHGQPSSSAILKQTVEDFIVDEDLGFELTGEGEHLCVQIKKRNCNTHDVADALGRWAKVPGRQVSHAGLKDKHALTTQWFSIQLPGKADPDISLFKEDGIEIVALKRHNKKIKTGALKGNFFTINLSKLELNDDLEQRLDAVKRQGVPNYFGSQRFGFNGNNIFHAQAMFSGKKEKNKKKRGLYLSAARSLLFNKVVSERIEQDLFNQAVVGDFLQLSGSNSFFAAEVIDDSVLSRLQSHELNITAPLWGRAKNQDDSAREQLETSLLAVYKDLQTGLEAAGLEMARRAMLLVPQHFEYQIKSDCLHLSFYLPSGCYATSVIRELVTLREVTS